MAKILKQATRRRWLLDVRSALPRRLRHRAAHGEEQDLDGDGQAHMERQHHNQEHLAHLTVRGAEDRVEVPQQEGHRETEADTDKDPVQEGDARPANQRDGYPDQVPVAIQGPALEEVGRLAAEVAEGEKETDGDEDGVAVYQSSGPCAVCQFRNRGGEGGRGG